MGQIFIKELKVFGYHGVYQQEKQEGQVFLVDCLIDTSFSEAAATDALKHTVDYGNVCLYIKEFFDKNSYDLLETAADKLATELLYAFSEIKRVKLSIAKPNAPIPMEFASVGVTVTKVWSKVAVSFGSNIEPMEDYLTGGIKELTAHPAIRNVVISDFMETEPYGYLEQDPFLNGAATFETVLTPRELLHFVHEIEQHANRKREIHWGPRTLDIDILLYEDVVLNEKDLVIPHLDMCHRAFVLEPLAMIAPGMIHPVCHKTIYDLNKILRQEIAADGGTEV